MTTPTPDSALRRTVAVTGATGLIGSALVTRLRRAGHTVRRLVRAGTRPEAGDIAWDPRRDSLDLAALEGVDAVVHLAGEPVAQRWTKERKIAIRESRTRTTSLLASTMARMTAPPSVFVSGSAMGYYGDRGDETLTETSGPGTDFLARVCTEWEGAVSPAQARGIRTALVRTGVVLSPDGGALARLLPIFRLGGGGPIGSGHQWMSWISLTDELRALEHAIDSPAVKGPVNLVAPNPVTNAEFARVLGHVLSRPAFIPVPAFALTLLYGEMAEATLLASQRAEPAVLARTGFQFAHPTLEQALRAELK